MESKVCTKCKIEKPLEEYSRKKPNKYQSQCRECVRVANRKSYRKWKEARNIKQSGYNKIHYQNNKYAYKDSKRAYMKKRRAEDPLFRFTCNTRVLIVSTFKRACNGNYIKSSSSIDMLGCSYEFFVSYISEQFEEGMTLDNYGEWHLDHKTPIATAETEEDIIRLNHYTNFQPLWAEDNFRKNDKLDWGKD